MYALIAVIFLASVFGVSAVSKLVSFDEFRDSVEDLTRESRFSSTLAAAVIGAEILMVILLLLGPIGTAGLVAMILLVAFTGVLGFNLLRGVSTKCACFGRLFDSTLSWWSVVRNLLLMALALATLGSSETLPGLIQKLTAQEIVIGILLLTVAGLGFLILFLLRYLGRTIRALDALGVDSVTLGALTGPISGARVPDLNGTDSDGIDLSLDQMISTTGAQGLLLLSDSCSHCKELVHLLSNHTPDMAALVAIQGDPDRARTNLGLDRMGRLAEQVFFVGATSLSRVFDIRGVPAYLELRGIGRLKGGATLGPGEIIETVTNQSA